MKFVAAIVVGPFVAFGAFCLLLATHRVVWLMLDAWCHWCDWRVNSDGLMFLSVMFTPLILLASAGLAGAIANHK